MFAKGLYFGEAKIIYNYVENPIYFHEMFFIPSASSFVRNAKEENGYVSV